MELQILKSPDIDQAIESELTLKDEYTFVSVTNEAQLLEAEAEIKKAKADQKLVVSKIKPLKEAIDNFKAKFLSKEKIETAKVEKFVSLQEAEIKKFKAQKLEEQRKAKEEAERKAKEEAERIRKEQEAKLEEERKAKQAELEALKTSEGTAEEKLKKAFELTDKINDLGTVVIPEIEVKAEKVVLKKDEVKTKKIFSISNEAAFIEWAIQNNRKLLEISISKSAFNEWIKLEANQSYSFLSSKEEIK